MGGSSSRVRALSHGGVDKPVGGSSGNEVFAISDNPLSPSADNQKEETKRCHADDPVCQEVKRRKGLLFGEFASDTSLHGIKYITNAKHHSIRRFVWLVLVVASTVGFVVTAVIHVQKLLKYDTTTAINYVPRSNQTLPAITICNYNSFKKSAIIDSGWEDIIPALLPYATQVSVTQTEVDVEGYENFTFPDWNVLELNEMWGHRIEDMLLECQWKQGYICGPQDFQRIWTDLGPCFTFNGGNVSEAGGGMESPYVANETSSEEALWIRLNLEQYDYVATPYQTAGFKILIHSRYDVATYVNPGIIQAPPGFTTVIPLTKTVIKSLKSPYVTNCTDGGLKYYATFTPNTCLVECLTDAVLKECGCFLPWGGISVEYGEVCDFETTAACAFNALVGVHCPCNMPCLEEQYGTRVSFTATPAQYAIPILRDRYNMTEDELRNNIVDLYIYFEDMRETVIEHKVAYDFYDFTSDVGGEIGLLLGASFLTIFEFLDYVTVYHLMGLALLKRCYHKNFGKHR